MTLISTSTHLERAVSPTTQITPAESDAAPVSTHLLLVEDDVELASAIGDYLRKQGYTISSETRGDRVQARVADLAPDLIILDVMLPGKDGFTVVAELRAAGYFVPVLMLTARGRPEDVLRGFESGADDYLPKPFELSVLLARLNALLRRRQWFHEGLSQEQTNSAEAQQTDQGEETGEEFGFNNRIIDFGNLELRTPEQTIRLTLMEAQLLRYLVKHEGNVVSRKAILENVWGLNEDTDTRAIDNFIVRLRKYIEDDPTKPEHLLTVRGVGYRFVAQA